MSFIERNELILFGIIFLLLGGLGFLLYSYDRSFRVHQETVSCILHRNARDGIFSSKVHVGHEGTTIEFMPLPKEVGTAGGLSLDPSSSVSPVMSPVDFPLLDPFIPYFFWLFWFGMWGLSFVLLVYSVRKKRKE